MLSYKTLTLEDIILLKQEGWLTEKQQCSFNIVVGEEVTPSDIENICPDRTIIDIIFEEVITTKNIHYSVNMLSYGLYKEGKPKVFKNLEEAIKFHYNKSRKQDKFTWTIEVNYEVVE